MPFALPTPQEIADRLAGGMEARFAAAGEVVDARSPNSPLAILAGVQALGSFDLYLYQQWLSAEAFPDTAEDVARHASIWGVERRPATAAIGTVTLAGTAGTAVPAGTLLAASGGQTFTTDAVASIGGGGTATVAVTATTPGAAGGLAAGTRLAPVSPVAGLSAATVAAGGLVGQDEEAPEDWRGRVLERIRIGPFYGQAGGYARIARAVAGVAIAAERESWIGAGSVGVVVAMAGPRAPTDGELAAVQTALDAARPVTARVVAVPAAMLPVPVTLSVVPDTPAIRAAVQAAIALFFAQEAAIGGTLYLSRLREAISSAAGEYTHSLALPAADVALGAAELAVPGTVTFT